MGRAKPAPTTRRADRSAQARYASEGLRAKGWTCAAGVHKGPPPIRRKSLVNNTDLADRIAETHGLTKADARKVVDSVFGVIAEASAKGEEVSLNGFGKFKVKDMPARQGRNPSTGAAIEIAASKKLTFAPAKAVKDKLNG
nr:HU family DNA-binding protein [Sphingomonas lycopersici]